MDFGDTRLPERFWAKARRQDDSGCWTWCAHIDPKGYGRIKFSGKDWRAHRLAYEVLVEPIPPGLEIDHLCRNRSCVNPTHMEAVVTRVNVLRGIGPTATNAAKTHCPRGHEYSVDNVIFRKNGWRICRECRNASRRLRRAAKACA